MTTPNYIEDLKSQVQGYKQRGRAILENLEDYISSSGIELTEGEREQLGLINKRTCKRRFSVQDVADLVGMSRSSIHRYIDLGEIPDRPTRETNGRTVKLGYTLEQVWEIRQKLGRLPKRDRMAIVGFLNQKGGVGKSTKSWMFGQYMALRGFRVLYVDTDPQASLSFLLGYRPRTDVGYWDTFAPFLLQDIEGAEEEFGDGGKVSDLRYCIRPTHWPNIDIIPACNDLLELEVQSDHIMHGSPNTYESLTGIQLNSPMDLLRNGVERLGDDYDVVIFDGTPSVNTSTMNIFSTCDAVVAPVPCGMLDFNSSVEFCAMIEEILDSYIEHGINPPLPQLHFLLAKFHNNAPSRFMEVLIRKTFTNALLTHYATASDEIQKHSTSFRSVYEINTADTNNSKALKRTREEYDALFEEIRTTVLAPIMNDRYAARI
ncbi:AAA family ATPase [Litorivivens sp.]|uniref:AAA family ATPase n=1 Tax=Litorivivens sp. TaxID=2020868 RepID=UPI00356743A4